MVKTRGTPEFFNSFFVVEIQFWAKSNMFELFKEERNKFYSLFYVLQKSSTAPRDFTMHPSSQHLFYLHLFFILPKQKMLASQLSKRPFVPPHFLCSVHFNCIDTFSCIFLCTFCKVFFGVMVFSYAYTASFWDFIQPPLFHFGRITYGQHKRLRCIPCMLSSGALFYQISFMVWF